MAAPISNEQQVGRALVRTGGSLALAESCTGGLIGYRITSVPGSSRYFKGAAVTYEDRIKELQVALVKFQRWVEATGQRIVIVLEWRDTAGKSGAINRVSENMNPRGAPVVALPHPTER